jgi:hypothetical protein
MLRKFLTTIVILTPLALTACGVGPGLTGNDGGGIIPYSPENRLVARDWAAEHCARYGKVPYHLVVYAKYGQYISFSCRFPRQYKGRYFSY